MGSGIATGAVTITGTAAGGNLLAKKMLLPREGKGGQFLQLSIVLFLNLNPVCVVPKGRRLGRGAGAG